MKDFRQQNLLNSQKQEAFILNESRKDSKIVKNKWKKERRFQIFVIVILVLIITSLFM